MSKSNEEDHGHNCHPLPMNDWSVGLTLDCASSGTFMVRRMKNIPRSAKNWPGDLEFICTLDGIPVHI